MYCDVTCSTVMVKLSKVEVWYGVVSSGKVIVKWIVVTHCLVNVRCGIVPCCIVKVEWCIALFCNDSIL